MTGEEMERAMAFVLQQQAHFETKLAVLAETQAESERRVLKLENSMGLMREALVGTMGLVQKLTEETNRRFVEVDKRITALDERLNAFIVVVERYITRNGNKPKS